MRHYIIFLLLIHSCCSISISEAAFFHQATVTSPFKKSAHGSTAATLILKQSPRKSNYANFATFKNAKRTEMFAHPNSSEEETETEKAETENTKNANNNAQKNKRLYKETLLEKPAQNRRFFMASSVAAITAAATTTTTGQQQTVANAAVANAAITDQVSLRWKVDPVNKRSGIKINDAEQGGYNGAFVTYLARFLLNFDTDCQKYWFKNTGGQIPRTATAEQVEQIRMEQFAAFSASVQLGLLQYQGGKEGPNRLLQELVQRYGTVATGNANTNTNSTTTTASDQERRIARSARRHIALLFALMEKNQPTQEITKLLASVDNGSVSKVQLNNATDLTGYEIKKPPPKVTFSPPQAGDDYQVAQGKAILKPTGQLLHISIVNPGSGYVGGSSSNAPTVAVSPPKDTQGRTAKVKTTKVSKKTGSIMELKLVDPGAGYTMDEAIEVRVEPPSGQGETAVLEAVLNMAVDKIEVTNGGTGYAVEKPLKVFIDPPSSSTTSTSTSTEPQPILAGFAFPTAEKSSFTSFRQDEDTKKLREEEQSFENKYNLKGFSIGSTSSSRTIRGASTGSASSGAPPLPFWSGRSSSAELLRLLPAGIGLDYDRSQQRYVLAVDTDFMEKYPAVLQQGSNRLLGTEFGPRGRAPIERNINLGLSEYLRFCLSGATCASLVHVALTPIDVIKTKVQVNSVKYPTIGSSFQTVFQEEGLPTFFSGWLPTTLGNFASGGVLYVTTEYIRRGLSEAAGIDASSLEVPIILAAAGVASAMGAVLQCPFEAVRIRTVAQPDYADGGGSINIAKKMLSEEGIQAFVDAIPIFLVRNVPYAMTKFTIFDLSTERIYQNFPAAQEDIRLSLLVSLIGGVLGGTAAAVVSNPADALISELKKSKSDISPQEAVSIMLERNGIASFFKGLPLRMVFYSLVASLTFVVYDFVRFLLGIGSDDLKLYLDVLGGSLGNPPS